MVVHRLGPQGPEVLSGRSSLANGQITVEGPFLDDGDSMLAVTGGTGAYAGVRGEMKLHSRNFNYSEFDFVYMLIR